MTGAEDALRFGTIVEVPVSDPRGHVKPHPVIIIAKDEDIALGRELVGIVISSSLPDPFPALCVPVPWHRPRHPMTGLDRRCAAVCDWSVVFHREEILYIRGDLPGKQLAAVVKKYRELTR